MFSQQASVCCLMRHLVLVCFPQSKGFEKTTFQVKQQKRCENKKMRMVFIGVGVAAILIIVGLIIWVSVG